MCYEVITQNNVKGFKKIKEYSSKDDCLKYCVGAGEFVCK